MRRPPGVSTGRPTHPGDEYGTLMEGAVHDQREKAMRFIASGRLATLVLFTLVQILLVTLVIQVPEARADDIRDLTLQTTHVRVDTSQANSASCTGQGCIAISPLFDPPDFVVQCKHSSCTFRLTFCGTFVPGPSGQDGDVAFVRFHVDGAGPIPGPTSIGARVFMHVMDPSGAPETRCSTTASADNHRGDHTIRVDFGAINIVGEETSVFLTQGIVTIDVYHQ